ncbi:Ribosomal RNA small subunit methyltransferase A [subsurface metagenome]
MKKTGAKKGLGQHFLTDRNIALKIVDSLQKGKYRTLIEVGPGKGMLTEFLLNRNEPKFLAVELDRESIDYLLETYTIHKEKFIHADFLKYSLDNLEEPLAIIGNLPYFISSQIFFKVLENRNKVHQVVCMIQKEVAERIASPHGNKTYGILSVLLQAYYTIEYLFTVHEHCFSPAPKVKSAVIRLTRNKTKELNCDPVLFLKVVKATFNQRRKMIRNSLRSIFINLPLESELLSQRPEQLTVDQFTELTNLVEELNR